MPCESNAALQEAMSACAFTGFYFLILLETAIMSIFVKGEGQNYFQTTLILPT